MALTGPTVAVPGYKGLHVRALRKGACLRIQGSILPSAKERRLCLDAGIRISERQERAPILEYKGLHFRA